MAERKPELKFPDRKISDTLLQFAKPILDGLGPDIAEAEMEPVLKIAWTVWNAVVYADVAGKSGVLDQVQTAMAHDPQLKRFVEILIDRKRILFGDDERLIGQYNLFRKGGEIRLRAEARDPRTGMQRPNR